MSSEKAAALAEALAELRQAAEIALRRLGEDGAVAALAAAELLEERLARGVDHTIVALQGGTGSGKSSLFNAIAEMSFSPVGVVRPTTTKATACVWGPGAEALLDWLGVERDSWIKRDSVLETHIGELRGLILVDLPDYDSAIEANRLIADKVMPLADVVIWVTDPQKYADQSLDERFVAAAEAHLGRVNMVVLNQVDTLAESDLHKVEQSLTALLVAHGLTDPVVALTSAKTGAGVDSVRRALMDQTGSGTSAMRRAAADLAAAARVFADTVDANRPLPHEWLSQAEAALVNAWVRLAVPPGRLGSPRVPLPGEIRQTSENWVAVATAELPAAWAQAVAYALATPINVHTRLSEVLAPIEAPPPLGLFRRIFGRAKAMRQREEGLAAVVRSAVESVAARTFTAPTRHVLTDQNRLVAHLDRVTQLASESVQPVLKTSGTSTS
jgi:GTP-binding protein EngB required for normal cell division